MSAFPSPPATRADTDGPASQSSPETPRWQRNLLRAVVALLVIGGAIALVLGHNSTSSKPLAPDNPEPEGAQAAAQILEERGINVHEARTTDQALQRAESGTTLLITRPDQLSAEQLAALDDTEADMVLANLTFATHLSELTEAVEGSPIGSPDPVQAECEDPHARAAEQLGHTRGGVEALRDDVEVCFPTGNGAGAYASWQQGERQMYALADGSLLSNEQLAEHGHAALALRILGQQQDLVWYVPTAGDTFGADDGSTGLLPPQAEPIGLQLLLIAVATMVWAGRRLGPVVSETLPVIVPAAETTRGRGRLYRRSRAHAHAAAGLRAGAASRLVTALGLPASTGPEQLVPAVARATGRDDQAIAALLYGPPPRDDSALLSLTRELDSLESEVKPS